MTQPLAVLGAMKSADRPLGTNVIAFLTPRTSVVPLTRFQSPTLPALPWQSSTWPSESAVAGIHQPCRRSPSSVSIASSWDSSPLATGVWWIRRVGKYRSELSAERSTVAL